mgnify:CR=1 FL=1
MPKLYEAHTPAASVGIGAHFFAGAILQQAGIITAMAIPLSMLFATSMMQTFGITASLMSLGAIDFGLIVDSSVIMVENCIHRIAHNSHGRKHIDIIRDAAIDALVDTLIAAPDRESLINVTRALDRVLLWNHFVVPNWHSNTAYVAYWNRFGRPAKSARYAPVAFDTWWVDEAKDRALQRGERK